MSAIYNERGDVIRSFVGKNANATDNRWLFQSSLSEKNDTQTVEKNQHSGFSSRPPAGAKLIVSKISDSYRVSVAEYDGITNGNLGEGETTVYSIDSGAVSAFINLLNTGILELNGNADFLVRYNELEIAFNQLQSDHDDLLAAVDLHTHTGVTVGSGTSGTLVTGLSPSTADITPAKVDEVLVP